MSLLVASTRACAAVAVAVAVASTTGCNKLKSAMNKDADGGTSSSGLSFLGSDFEGEISMNVSSKSRSSSMSQIVFGMKKPKYRIDTVGKGSPGGAAGSGTLLLDLPTKKGYALSPQQKTAVVLDFDKLKTMRGQIPGLPAVPKDVTPTTPPKIEKTGTKDVVAGYTCEIWIVTSDGKKADTCVAEGITWVDIGDLGFGSTETTLTAVMTEANRFPLRVVTHDTKGVEETRMEATKVEKKKLDDARFNVPPDYRVVDMATLVGGMGGMGGVPSFKPR